MMHRLMPVLAAFVACIAMAVSFAQSAAASPDAAGKIAVAQLSPDRALTGGRPAAGTESAAPPSVMAQAYNWLLTQQQRLNRELANAIKDLKAAGSINAALVLGFIGFSYGVLHAAGPGHGKAIISSYVLANQETVRRGIMLSFLSAFIQALSAIVLVGILAIALNATSMEMRVAEGWIETVSWAFVTAVGAWLLYGQIRQILARRQAAPANVGAGKIRTHTHSRTSVPATAHREDHVHTHDCGCAHDHSHTQPSHAHEHAHDHDDCCGHAHMPDPKDLQGDLTWAKALAIAFSVGIRPCTGVILVLVFALSQGLLWAGVFATFAMAIGTALTVSVLAALAVGSRELAARLGGEGSGWATAVSNGAGLLGASLVLLMGAVFFVGSLQPQAPF
ncbi:MAG TPA: nickel/cobalt transporter [Hyphomicrobium sp.]|nr:nickel/cobalt transporter [Hyphomicrobium sp.]